MTTTQTKPLTLNAETASDLMVENPVSIRANATIDDAFRLFSMHGISVAPVVDAAGRPVGVISRTDLIVHKCVKLDWPPPGDLEAPNQASPVAEEAAVACELMTPAVFSVSPSTPAASVISQLLAMNVHHLFVIDATGVLVGVIGATDVLWHLHE
jgi:CBS-domain-containing membrane protein